MYNINNFINYKYTGMYNMMVMMVMINNKYTPRNTPYLLILYRTTYPIIMTNDKSSHQDNFSNIS